MSWCMKYFECEAAPGVIERFKQNRFIKTVYVFRANCLPFGNRWNGPGYGWGQWQFVGFGLKGAQRNTLEEK